MRLYTKQRVVKGYAVKITDPLMLDPSSEAFEYLYNKIPTISKIRPHDIKKDSDAQIHNSDPLEREKSIQAQEEEANQKILYAERLVSDAESKAQEILKRAKEEADKIIHAAHESVEEFKNEVAENTRQEIILKTKAEAEGILLEAQDVMTLANKVLENEYAQANQRLVKLAVLIAERVIKASLTTKPDFLLNIINSVTLLPQEKEDLCLQLSAEDAAWLTAQGHDTHIPCAWIINNSLRKGDIYLEHKKGFYDAQIQTQLAIIEQKLTEELAREHMGQAGEQTS